MICCQHCGSHLNQKSVVCQPCCCCQRLGGRDQSLDLLLSFLSALLPFSSRVFFDSGLISFITPAPAAGAGYIENLKSMEAAWQGARK
jgi:hypothetical protein